MWCFDGGELRFGDGEGYIDGLYLIDGNELHAVGHDHVALFDA